MKILANDGMATSGIMALEVAGFKVDLSKIPQDELIDYINEHQIEMLLVRSATTARKELIDACPTLKLIGRGGVGMDNIDVDYAKSKGIVVINTPDASSHSVAELVFAHMYGMARFLHDSNRNMPLEGDTNFNVLKKAYAGGKELTGKTLGLLGFGRIGQAAAKIALGNRMKVIAYDPFIKETDLELKFFDGQKVSFHIKTVSKEEVLQQADFISLHVPKQKDYVISTEEFKMMKDGVCIVNAARGGVINEEALIEAIENGKVSNAAMDVFENEPKPPIQLLMHPNLSLTPHIGAATKEAQSRIGEELAQQIIEHFKK